MRFLFETTIHDGGEELKYNVYEFKLQPGRYKAELISQPSKLIQTSEVVFWQEHIGWKTLPDSKHAKRLAQIIAYDIRHHKN